MFFIFNSHANFQAVGRGSDSRLPLHFATAHAGVAQLVEHLICNQRVGGSNPSASSIFRSAARTLLWGFAPVRRAARDLAEDVSHDFAGAVRMQFLAHPA